MPGSFAAAIKDWRDVDERSAEESEIRLLKRLPYLYVSIDISRAANGDP